MAIDVAEIRERNGFKFAVTRGTKADHASHWSFEDEQHVRDMWWHPKPDEVVLDIGCAFGSYAMPALVAGAKVVAFNPANFDAELFQINLNLNPELATRCMQVRDGLHREDGWFDPDHNVFAKEPVRDTSQHDTDPWLYVRSLDSWLEERPGITPVDWLKIDVEGAELAVLQGAEDCLRRWKPRLLIELHLFHDQQIAEKISRFLYTLDLGYVVHGPVPYHGIAHAFYEVPR
jgi:FkbM family methyltransferase